MRVRFLVWTVCVLTAGAAALASQFSPDGSLLLLELGGAGDGRLAIVRVAEPDRSVPVGQPDGGPAAAVNGSEASFSPDGKQIVFSSLSGSDSGRPARNLYIVNVDGSGLRRLTTQGGRSPVWSYDGSFIAYLMPDNKLCRVDPDGGNWRVLANRIPAQAPLRSLPDGKSYAVPRGSDGRMAWYAFTPPSRHLVRLTPMHTVPRDAVWPALSLDGRSVAYLRARPDCWDLLTETAGQAKRRAVFSPDDATGDPASQGPLSVVWSNDGKSVAVSCCGAVWLVGENGEKVRIGGSNAPGGRAPAPGPAPTAA